MQKSFKIILGISIFVSMLMGCGNTMQGVGKDMQENGKAIQKSLQ